MNKIKEYMVHVWGGGAWNKDANPSIEKDYGISRGYHYFNTEEDKNKFLEILNKPQYKKQGIAHTEKYGFMSHKRTIFVPTFKYKDKEFVVKYDFGNEYSEENALFYFENGNYCCDCNRSMLIQEQYGEDAIPELGCGYKIEMTDYHFEYVE